jgi:hydroxymethylpyrimidine pyrophosphatase-like HAD family hydrolase
MQFKAAMFDFDGTITERGAYCPSKKVAFALCDLAKKIPIAFCTGRQLESFEKRGLTTLLEIIKPKDRESFLKNLFLFAENGAIGYAFDLKKNKFKPFHKVGWPNHFINKKKLKKILSDAIKEYGEVYENAHRIVIVMRTNLHDYEDKNIDDVYKLSDKIYAITVKILKKINKNYEKSVHIGNSGIGVLVCPANGDKDAAIHCFAKFLQRKRKIKFSKNAREILVMGDSPQNGGNDYYFLSGKYGTPFTVGYLNKKLKLLKPVFNENGKRLLNEKGTFYMIKSLLKE